MTLDPHFKSLLGPKETEMGWEEWLRSPTRKNQGYCSSVPGVLTGSHRDEGWLGRAEMSALEGLRVSKRDHKEGREGRYK